nr:hypothetical protein GCM10020092_019200 [Actinoplanes digitatis]
MLILVGLLLVILVTAVTGYFVAQEFGYVAVDRSRLRQQAERGDKASARALKVTERLSFVLSGAQLGITVTALIVGYVAQPYLGEGMADLFGQAGVPTAVTGPLSFVLALLIATVVQMVLGELAPKNLAIVRSEALAKALGRSTLFYLAVFGPIIKLFDKAAAGLLRRIGIEPIEELPEGATEEDLEQIIAESRAGGHLDPELSALLDRGLDFRRRTASEVMVPRVDVVTVRATDPASRVVALLDTGRSRFPVRAGTGVDEIIGVVGITDVLPVPLDRAPDGPGRDADGPAALRTGLAAAAGRAGPAARRPPPARLRRRRIRGLRRHHHPRGHRGGAGRADPRRGRPARAVPRPPGRRLVDRAGPLAHRRGHRRDRRRVAGKLRIRHRVGFGDVRARPGAAGRRLCAAGLRRGAGRALGETARARLRTPHRGGSR